MMLLNNPEAPPSPFPDRKPIVCACGDHAFVAVTRGYTTMVSPEDAHLLERRWHAEPHGGRIRVRGRKRAPTDPRNLAAFVLGLTGSDVLLPDHKNLDPTDNRRSNLRLATVAQNQSNRSAKAGRDLPKGVSRVGARYVARIKQHGKTIRLGAYDTIEEAHQAYAEEAARRFGEFARAA
jgi:hypothetical protein